MAGSPWREQYFREVGSVGSSFWPFTLYRPHDFRGEYINISGWERRSWTASDTPPNAPRVGFFGGSAMWGEGQRDGFTVASMLARLAAEEGVPIIAKNFGQRGWVIWQEMTLYEQLLAAGERIDLSVFYDGANDMSVQTGPVHGVPTFFDVAEYAARLHGPTESEEPLSIAVRRWWEARSLLYRAAVQLDARLVGSVAASPLESEPVDGESGRNPSWASDGVDVYERGRSIVQALSEDHEVSASFYWQPHLFWDDDQYLAARALLTPATIDVSDSLAGHDDVYLDAVHTNELGAAIVAEEIWTTLGPRVHTWYEQQR